MGGRGGKLAVVLSVLVVVLVAGFVVADRASASAAEKMIADQTVKEMSARGITSPERPKAQVDGFPFLGQVVRGVYHKVTIDIQAPQTNDVKLDRMELVAHDVHASLSTLRSGNGQVVAENVTGTATLGWPAVIALLEIAGLPGIDPSAVQVSVVDNQLRLRIPLTVIGQNVTLTAAGSIAVSAGKVRVTVNKVTPEGMNLPPIVLGLLDQYQRRMSVDIKIPALPYKLTINKVVSNEHGIVATASAANVVLAG